MYIAFADVEDVRLELQSLLSEQRFVTDKTGVKMIEIVGASFLADKPAIFGIPNEDYIKRELEWYESQSLFVRDIPGKTPAIWEQVASKHGKINSNYGYLIFSLENGNQYQNAFSELKKNPYSRRAVMIYQRPTMWQEYDLDGMSDFICTNTVQYMIRNHWNEGEKLHAVVQMRSNDAWAGYRNDFAWQQFVLRKLATDLEIPVGNIIWNAGSFHVYARHFDLLRNS